MKKNQQEIEEEPVQSEANATGNAQLDFNKMTGRYLYFKPEPNKQYELIVTDWRMGQVGQDPYGLLMKVVSINKVACDPIKEWNTSSKQIVKALEPIIGRAIKQNQGQIEIVFEKILNKGEQDLKAKFRITDVNEPEEEIF